MMKHANFLLIPVVLVLAACPSEKKDDSATAAYAALALSGAGCQAPTFTESAANQTAGSTQYTNQCASCHGASGGGGSGPALTGYSGRSTFQSAAAKIHCTMPLGNSTACVNDCARDVAKHIRTL